MKTPEEIKKGLECLTHMHTNNCKTSCSICEYYVPNYFSHEVCGDALEYINELDKAVINTRRCFEEKCDELQDAYKTIDGAENCSNCVYGDGTITGTNYCYDCRWFNGENNHLKWVGTVDALEDRNNGNV